MAGDHTISSIHRSKPSQQQQQYPILLGPQYESRAMGSAKRKRQRQQQHQNQQQQRKKRATAVANAAEADGPAPLLSPELAAELGIEEGDGRQEEQVLLLQGGRQGKKGSGGGDGGSDRRRRDGRGQVVEDEVRVGQQAG